MSNAVIVYSATCTTPTYTEDSGGIANLVEVSKVTVASREMVLEEINDWSKKTNKSIDLSKELLEFGKSAFEWLKKDGLKKSWSTKIGVVSQVANILKSILKFIPDPTNPMIQDLQNLADNVEKLGEKIRQNFDEIKSMISEVTFFVKIMSPCTILTRHMLNVIKEPGPKTVHNFKRSYKKHSPLHLAYYLKSFLDRETTNPLKVAINAEKGKTKATFQKWEDIISRILGQFMFLEAFSSGIQGKDNQFNWNRLLDVVDHIFSSMAEWKSEYAKDDGYWKEMVEYVPVFLEQNDRWLREDKAKHIKEKLDKYLTSDAFYISVFSLYYSENQYWEDIQKPDQFLRCYKPGKDNAFVYRSKLANSVDLKELEAFGRRVTSLKSGNNKNKIIEVLKRNPIPNAGFTILCGGVNEEIWWSNCPRREWGPGWFTDYFDFGGPRVRRLIVGYF